MAHNLPQLWVYAILFSLLRFLCILLFKEMFVQVQALQQRVQGPRSQIMACLIVNYPISHFYDLFIVRAFISYFQRPLPRGHVKIYISWLPVGGALLLVWVNKL